MVRTIAGTYCFLSLFSTSILPKENLKCSLNFFHEIVWRTLRKTVQYLLISEHQYRCFAKFITFKHFMQFLFSYRQSFSISTINHQQNELCVWVISVPGSPKRLLTSQIPHDEMNIVPHNFFHITTNSWRCVYNFVHQKLIQYCSLSSIVEADQTDLVFWKKKT